MPNLKISPQAIIDLEDIFEYSYQKWGVSQADKYQNFLFDGMNSILENPEIGAIYPFKSGGYRKLNINKHLIFYIVSSSSILIIRILHERIDLNAALVDLLN